MRSKKSGKNCKRKSNNSSLMYTSATRLKTKGGQQRKLLMKDWLIQKADDESIPGLEWYDKSRHLIRISWIHGSRHCWDIDKHAKIFRAWAEHSGRHEPAKSNPKRWKANFRCALNSLSDVKEVPELRKKGQHAYKVYKIENSNVKTTKPRSQPEIADQESEVKVEASFSEEETSEGLCEDTKPIHVILANDQSNDSVLSPNESTKSADEECSNSEFLYDTDNEIDTGESFAYVHTVDGAGFFTESDYHDVLKQILDNPQIVGTVFQLYAGELSYSHH